jgi:hypothetical protein
LFRRFGQNSDLDKIERRSYNTDMLSFDPNQQPILDETIDDVSQSTWIFIRTKYKSLALAVLTISIVLAIIGGVGLFMQNDYSYLLWLAIGILIIFYIYVQKNVQRLFMQQFAQANGYTYQDSADISDKSGYIFNIGHSRLIQNYVSGTYQNCPIDLFDYQYTIGGGKNSETIRKTVFEINFNLPLPHITLKNHELMDLSWNLEKVKLEGDFADKFDLFVQKGFEIEALEIFTPDLMSKIEDNWRFKLEFIQTKLYLYAAGTVTRKTDLQNFYDAVKYLITKLDPLIAKMQSSIVAIQNEER